MKTAILFIAAVSAVQAGNLERFTDSSLNTTQRNGACLDLRGDKSAEVVAAMRSALSDIRLQSCAGENLRLAGASAELVDALGERDASARAVAARELGSMQKREFIPALRKAADDQDLLVSSNALEGLVRYEDHSTAPQLREIALSGGMLTSLAVNALSDWNDPEILGIARKLVDHKDPGEQLIAIRVMGMFGSTADLPKLRELAKNDVQLGAGNRGFGLMPAISISRAANTAIQSIESRAGVR